MIFISFLTPEINQVNLEAKSKFEISDTNLSADDKENWFNLFVLEKRNNDLQTVINRSLVIMDMDGNYLMDTNLGHSDDISAAITGFVNSTTILYVDESKVHLFNLATGRTIELGPAGHHEIEYSHDRGFYFTLNGYVVPEEEGYSVYDRITEYNYEGTVIWTKSTHTFIDLSHWCPYEDMFGTQRDVTHANAISFDEENDNIYVNIRNTNTFYKIDHDTGSVLWGLGEYGDFVMYDINGTERDSLFYHAHALEMIDQNTFVLFDNDYHNQTDVSNMSSRLIEITIDTDEMIANITREWISPDDYYSSIWGDCDLLPNNNFLGVFGTPDHPDSEYGARLVEVNDKGEIIWEHSFLRHLSYSMAVNRIERFRFSPLVSEPYIVDQGENGSFLCWDVWYNFRSTTKYPGEYYLSIDGELVETQEFLFPRNWKPLQLSHNITGLAEGEHDISLVVSDEGGHFSNNTDFYLSYSNITIFTIDESGLNLLQILGSVSSSIYVVVLIRKKYKQGIHFIFLDSNHLK